MDLSTTYLGLNLPHPLIVGAGPLGDNLDTARRLEDAGAAALVMRSLFEEQLTAEVLATHRATAAHADAFAEAPSYLPEHDSYVLGPDAYLNQLRRLKEVLDIPVIASLNGVTTGGWLSYARLMEQAGADAIELNVYFLGADENEAPGQIEARIVEMVQAVRKAVKVPIAVKLSPFFTSLAQFARELVRAGADGLVLFNRFLQPDIDLDALDVFPHLRLSDSSELALRLRWLAILSAKLREPLAVSGGVHTGEDALKAVMCGASAVQLVSVLLRRGPLFLTRIRDEMTRWLAERDYVSLRQAHGSLNLLRSPDAKAYERANYIHILQTWQPA